MQRTFASSIRRWNPSRSGTRLVSTTPSSRLDLRSIDSKWQRHWEEAQSLRQDLPESQKEKAYILAMFPYPSGALHMGHLRVYTISDVLGRFKRMRGYKVLHPMGWDAFGLPAENAAIERGVNPAEWTVQNIEKMKEQLKLMSGNFDWDREFMTCSPSFYKHTQHIFLKLYEQGLAYQAEALVNYDPVDKTVLANEQVDANGNSWRSGAKVKKIKLKQWFLRISAFRENLLEGLTGLATGTGWPERVLAMQRHWIGKSKGATVRFNLIQKDSSYLARNSVDVFTTRPDTLPGVQYVALSLSHPMVQEIAKTSEGLRQYITEASSLPPESKSGYLLQHILACNPLSCVDGFPMTVKQPVPVFVAPYVLSEYGEGAVMGVPGHDQRDFDFWSEQGGHEDVRTVITRHQDASADDPTSIPFIHPGVLTHHCGPFRGMTSSEATDRITALLTEINMGSSSCSWRLRDWLISRQRYWGTPIPIIHCENCGAVPVPLDRLPVELPPMPQGVSVKGNPLDNAHEWVNTKCPRCSQSAKRDTDTMDTFVDSSWYYMRFPDSQNEMAPFSPQAAASSLPVDIYIGGVEHAILHLLYARFIYKFLSKSTLFPSGWTSDEPFRTLISQGMVHGKTYSDPETGRFLHPSELNLSDPASPKIIATGNVANMSFEKMSKSKYNGVDPTETISKFGADATRAHIMFAAPVSEVLDWDEEKIIGMQRWFNRYWRLIEDVTSTFPKNFAPTDYLGGPLASNPLLEVDSASLTPAHISLIEATNAAIASITTTFDSNPYALNTAVSDLIKLTNLYSSELCTNTFRSIPSHTALSYILMSAHLRLLAPIAPALCEEGWERLHAPGKVGSIHSQPFPNAIPIPSSATQLQKQQTVAIQIDGKLRFTMDLPASLPAHGIAEEQLRKRWLLGKIEQSAEGCRWLKDERSELIKQKRVVVVGDGKEGIKLVNIVLEKRR